MELVIWYEICHRDLRVCVTFWYDTVISGVPRGGGSTPLRNSEGPPNRAKLNPIVKTVKNC